MAAAETIFKQLVLVSFRKLRKFGRIKNLVCRREFRFSICTRSNFLLFSRVPLLPLRSTNQVGSHKNAGPSGTSSAVMGLSTPHGFRTCLSIACTVSKVDLQPEQMCRIRFVWARKILNRHSSQQIF